MRRFAMILAVTGLILAIGSAVEAATVFSNYWDITVPDDVYDAWNNTSPTTEIIEPFTTNSGGPWSLDSIMLNAYGGGIMGGGSSPATISIYEDNSGLAGSLVSFWDVNIDTGMGEDFSFSVSSVALDYSTDYWFGVEATGSNAVGWRRSNSWGSPGVAGHVFEITGVVVPIPGAVWLLGSGLLGLIGIRRMRKS